MKISAETRRLGGKAVGSKGSGKTLYAAYQTYCDLQNGIGTIVIDPLGAVTNYLLNRIAYSGDPKLWKRVVYVPVGGMEILDKKTGEPESWVVPTPFLYKRTERDGLQDQTSRFVGFMARLSPQQENAPVQGMPAIRRTANFAGMILAASGRQLVPDASYLIDAMSNRKPDPAWSAVIREAAQRHPFELRRAAKYFLETFPALGRDQLGHVSTFLSAVDAYASNERLAAQYGADKWGVDISSVEKGTLIIFDCRYLPDEELRAGITWIFTRCMEYFRSRGPRRDTVGLVIDELSWLVNEDNPILENDLRNLISVFGRNYGISPFFTYQEVTQPPVKLRLVMDMVGYSLYGSTNDYEAAAKLVERLDTFDPYWVKDTRRSPWNKFRDPVHGGAWIEETNNYFPIPEQDRMNQSKHRNRLGMQFAVAMNSGEGSASTYRGECNIRSIRNSQNYDFTYADRARELLVKTHGRRVSDVMREIEARQPLAVSPGPGKTRQPAPVKPPGPAAAPLFDSTKKVPPRTSID